MARDYKNRRRPKRKNSGTGWSGSFIGGLSVGLAIALIVHLYHAGRDDAAEANRLAPGKVSSLTEPAAPAEEDPSYDFYDLLPDFEVVIPEQIRPSAPARDGTMAASGDAYFIQVGSFRRFEDADRRKASLALLGIESAITEAQVESRSTHRVQIGPIHDTGELQRLQTILSENGIEQLLLRSKEPRT